MNEFTGERVIPGEVETDLWNEHFARYAFAPATPQDEKSSMSAAEQVTEPPN